MFYVLFAIEPKIYFCDILLSLSDNELEEVALIVAWLVYFFCFISTLLTGKHREGNTPCNPGAPSHSSCDKQGDLSNPIVLYDTMFLI